MSDYEKNPMNLVYLQAVKLSYHPQGNVKYGYFLCDDYEKDFGILDELYDGIDLLQSLFLSETFMNSDHALSIMDESIDVGLYINGQWFDWEQVQHVWVTEEKCECDS